MEHLVLRTVGQRIRDLRKQKGYSQEVLGERAGFHFSYIGGVERAEKNISLLNLEKLAIALDVSVNELFLYGKFTNIGTSEKDLMLNKINEKLSLLKSSELKKINLIINELFQD